MRRLKKKQKLSYLFRPTHLYVGLEEMLDFLKKDKKISLKKLSEDFNTENNSQHYKLSCIYYNKKHVLSINDEDIISLYNMMKREYGYAGIVPYRNPGMIDLNSVQKKMLLFTEENMCLNKDLFI